MWVGLGEAKLALEEAKWNDTGFYYCHARNRVGAAVPAVTALVVSRKLYISILLIINVYNFRIINWFLYHHIYAYINKYTNVARE